MDERETVIQLSMKYHGDWTAITNGLKKHETVISHQVKEPCITIFDDCYPNALRKLRFPPWVLYYRGNLELLKYPSATIVGSRAITSYGKQMTTHVVNHLPKEVVVVSGLAKGVDSIAHRSALFKGMHTIGVTGCGLNIHYPSENEDLYQYMMRKELILSEYPEGTWISKRNFPWRNRILAALSPVTIVTQATVRSGTSSTVNEALNLGKEVWCVPYPYGTQEGEGCNMLIQQGANVLYQDIDVKHIGNSILHA